MDGGPKHRDNAAAKAGGLTGRRNAPAQGTRNNVASRADEAGAATDQSITSEPMTPPVAMVPSIKLSLEAGGGWARNGFEDSIFNGRGFVGGISGELNFPIGGVAYTGLGVSVLGSGISGTISDPTTSHIRLLVPVDAIIGLTFTPWGVSVYGFGGVAIGDVKVTVPPFSATQSMAGWSAGIGADVQLTPVLSAGVKYRHFDLAKQDFSIFAGEASNPDRAGVHSQLRLRKGLGAGPRGPRGASGVACRGNPRQAVGQ
jgi:opacity protein-like surface antigen